MITARQFSIDSAGFHSFESYYRVRCSLSSKPFAHGITNEYGQAKAKDGAQDIWNVIYGDVGQHVAAARRELSLAMIDLPPSIDAARVKKAVAILLRLEVACSRVQLEPLPPLTP